MTSKLSNEFRNALRSLNEAESTFGTATQRAAAEAIIWGAAQGLHVAKVPKVLSGDCRKAIDAERGGEGKGENEYKFNTRSKPKKYPSARKALKGCTTADDIVARFDKVGATTHRAIIEFLSGGQSKGKPKADDAKLWVAKPTQWDDEKRAAAFAELAAAYPEELASAVQANTLAVMQAAQAAEVVSATIN